MQANVVRTDKNLPMPRAAAKPATRLDAWLQEVWDREGTDLLLTVGTRPLIRSGGALLPLEDDPVLSADDVAAAVDAALARAGATRSEDDDDLDFSFDWESRARFRGNSFRQRGHDALALRMIPYAIPTLDDLGVPHSVQKLVTSPQGLVLVTGPTGAGKSTTLASMIDAVNRNRACHILTIEDPIEYVHEHRRAAVSQREVGIDTPSFAAALRSALREDPDVLLIGEMRDTESIAAALTIAETGHLVFATLHTNDTAQAIDRIIDVFPADRRPQIQVQLSATLQGVVYQRLLPTIDGGLVAAFEVLVATQAVRNLVREGKSAQLRNIIATHKVDGMRTLETDLSRLVAEGVITKDEAMARSLFPNEIGDGPPAEDDAASNGGGAASGGKRRGRARRT